MAFYTNSLYDENRLPEHCHADKFDELPMLPGKDIILCRDQHGIPTAVYGEDSWDLNPYRLSASRVAIIHFRSILELGDGAENLVNEIKIIIFYLIYTRKDTGFSVATVLNYIKLLKRLARFCYSFHGNPFVLQLSIAAVLSNKSYLLKFVKSCEHMVNFSLLLKALLINVRLLPKGLVTPEACDPKILKFTIQPSKQCCVIPSRIYILLISNLNKELNHVYAHMQNLDLFIENFKDPLYGTTRKFQKAKLKVVENYNPSFSEALAIYNLENLFSGAFYAKDRNGLRHALVRMQYLAKHVIHLYTGMRDEEVMRLKRNSIVTKEVQPGRVDETGKTGVPPRSINVISTTTKYTGNMTSASWIATPEVLKAVTVAEMIHNGLSSIIELSFEETENSYLFLSVKLLTRKHRKEETIPCFNKVMPKVFLDNCVIEEEDIHELCAIDPERNFREEMKFKVGNIWPISSHQYRRSLSFYASNSGFVSLPSLKYQFKHVSLLMTKYYSNGFQNLKSIFGNFDADKNEYLLSSTHVAFEFQMGTSNHSVDALVSKMLDDSEIFYGGAGSHLQKSRSLLRNDHISIVEFRKETEKLVRAGELSYRTTLLGGCMKAGPCQNFILGDVTGCLSCDASVIQRENLDRTLSLLREELSFYESNSGEHQLCLTEILKLERFNEKIPVTSEGFR